MVRHIRRIRMNLVICDNPEQATLAVAEFEAVPAPRFVDHPRLFETVYAEALRPGMQGIDCLSIERLKRYFQDCCPARLVKRQNVVCRPSSAKIDRAIFTADSLKLPDSLIKFGVCRHVCHAEVNTA